MKKRKNLNIWLPMSMFLLAMGGMAGGSAVDSNSIVEDGIEYCIQTDKSVYSLGENVEMLYRVTNLSEDDVEFIFTFGPLDNTCDWMVDKDELRIWDNLGRPGTGVMTSLNLSPSESYEYTHTWDMAYKNGDNILPGNYNVTGVLAYGPIHERYVPVSVQIQVIPEPAMIYYVDVDANGLNNGSSWEDAYNFLQDALAAAASGDEIWMAQGIYKPDQGIGITPGGRMATFRLKNGVAIRGGYAGFGEPDPNARDIDTYESILSGDLDSDDVEVNDPCDLWNEPSRAENCYHVVTGSGTDETVVLDGFTITGGNANGSGSNDDGGGMYNSAGSPTLNNCTFEGNSARWHGGGMYNRSGSSPILVNCIFSGNSARIDGGGMRNYESSPTLTNCTFSHNNSSDGDGGGMKNSDSSPTLTNCTFSGNRAWGDGGGMDSHTSVTGQTPCNLTLTDCTFIENAAGIFGGGMSSYEASATLTNCIFSGNSAEYYGGGMYNHGTCPTLTNCIFSRNSADEGGGIHNWYHSNATLTGCTFSGNSADGGGAIWNQRDSNPTLTSCILWGNTAIQGDSIYLALYSWAGIYTTSITISYSDVEGGYAGVYVETGCTLNWGEGNIGADPLFADSVAGDYHLSVGSPCIDAGDPAYIPSLGETDIDGKPRVMGGRIDMGAFEYSPLIPAEVRIVPRTINLASKGKWITSLFWLPEDYDVADIEPNSVLLEGEVEPEWFSVDEQQQVVIVRFSRSEVQGILNAGQVELTVNGELTDGTIFEGRDIIRVIDKGKKK